MSSTAIPNFKRIRILNKILENNNMESKDVKIEPKAKKSAKTDIHFVVQRKGGSGKSTYVYSIANYCHAKGVNIQVRDIDTDINSSFRFCKFVGAERCNISDEHNNIDRSEFEAMLDNSIESEHELYVFDFGGDASKQFFHFLNHEESAMMFDYYASMPNINIHVHIVLQANNDYVGCSEYAEKIFLLSKDSTTKHIVKNMFRTFTEAQEKDMKDMSKKYDATIRQSFLTVLPDERSRVHITNMMDDGLPMSVCTYPPARMKYTSALEKLDFPID